MQRETLGQSKGSKWIGKSANQFLLEHLQHLMLLQRISSWLVSLSSLRSLFSWCFPASRFPSLRRLSASSVVNAKLSCLLFGECPRLCFPLRVAGLVRLRLLLLCEALLRVLPLVLAGREDPPMARSGSSSCSISSNLFFFITSSFAGSHGVAPQVALRGSHVLRPMVSPAVHLFPLFCSRSQISVLVRKALPECFSDGAANDNHSLRRTLWTASPGLFWLRQTLISVRSDQ